MPAPTKAKTWQFNVNSLQYGSSALILHQNTLYQIKSAMIGFGSNPWTVSGSSNSSASSMDGTDRWTSATTLVWGSSAHSWIVLRQAGIATKFEVCLDLASASDYIMNVIVSPVNGFGTANGGTNGSTTTRPTATDEVTLLSTANASGWVNGSTNTTLAVHVMQSSDGQCTRAIICVSGVPCSLMILDAVNNGLSGWTGTKAFGTFYATGAATNQITFGNYNDSSSVVWLRHNTTNGNFYLSTPGYGSSAFPRQPGGAVVQDVTKEWPFCPIGLWSETSTLRGLWGTVYDLYWGSTTPNSMVSYDASSVPFSWAQFGNMIFPWNGTAPQRTG